MCDLRSLSAAVLLVFAASNSTAQPQTGPTPAMFAEKPQTILIAPPRNNSTAADAPLLYTSTINEPLSNTGFYVLPIDITDAFLRSEGFSEGEQVLRIDPGKFSELMGADAVLYTTIHKWDRVYYVVGGHLSVSLEFRLVSCRTGELLWAYADEIRLDTTATTEEKSLFGQILGTALKTAGADYANLAMEVNKQALKTMPVGRYNKHYDKKPKNK